jgi:hypothetical protein
MGHRYYLKPLIEQGKEEGAQKSFCPPPPLPTGRQAHPPPSEGECVVMELLEERQSGSKVLERGSFRYGEPSLAKNHISPNSWRP